MNQQLAFAIQSYPKANLNDFIWTKNALLKQQIELTLSGKGERFLYLWGSPGCGKSHLLQGICQWAGQTISNTSNRVLYLPLSILAKWGPASLEGIGPQDVITIDDLDTIAGQLPWERALFDLYNQIFDSDKGILIASSCVPPIASTIILNDLRSRLHWGLSMEVKAPDDQDKVMVLKNKAKQRGFSLEEHVAFYLIHRCGRNMNDLDDILNQLDQASLVAKRKVTIPFVKSVLNLT